jgi:small subunit ribosomal protein S11
MLTKMVEPKWDKVFKIEQKINSNRLKHAKNNNIQSKNSLTTRLLEDLDRTKAARKNYLLNVQEKLTKKYDSYFSEFFGEEKNFAKDLIKYGTQVKTLQGILYIKFSSNNTLIVLTDLSGRIVFWKSAGQVIKGATKSGRFAKEVLLGECIKMIKDSNYSRLSLHINGQTFFKRKMFRMLKKAKLKIFVATDVTGVPHNGCRPKKFRRI